jgi:signal transduction histidine kinase
MKRLRREDFAIPEGRSGTSNARSEAADTRREAGYIRWLLILSAVVVIGVLGLVGWMVADSRRIALDQAKLDAGNLLALLDEDVRQTVETYDLALQSVVSGLEDKETPASGRQAQQLLLLARSATATYPGRIAVLDAAGAVVLSSGSSPADDAWLGHSPAFAFHAGQRWMGPHVSGPYRDPHRGTWVLVISRRLESPGGAFGGVALGTLDLGYLRNLLYSISLSANDEIALWDFDHNLVVARPYVDHDVGTHASDLGLFDHLDRVLQGHYEAVPSATEGVRMVSFRQVGQLPLVLSEIRLKSDVLSEWRQRAFIASLGGVVLTLVALALGIASALEIRRRAAAERAVKAAQGVAEAASQAKSRFLAVMSHELRSPLHAVIGFSDLIVNQSAGPIGDRRYLSYAEDIRASATHLLELMTEVLDHAKAEAGHLELIEEPVDLAQVIGFAVRMLKPRADDAGVEIDAHRTVCAVMGDERRLRQIMINLLTNAVKFTPAGGRVAIDCRECVDDGGISIDVTDTGIGIAEADLERIFEPFERLGGSGGPEGSGLGLPLTRRLVELHGGDIHVASRLGVGTTITIDLPPARTISRET